MIFLKAIIFACAVCFLGNLIICLVWKKSSYFIFEFLPYLLAFFSLSILFFIKVLPYHPIWLLSPIGIQVLFVAGTNSLLEREADYFEKSDMESIFSFLQLSFISIRDRVVDSIDESAFFQRKNDDSSKIESEKESCLEVSSHSHKKQDFLEIEPEGKKKSVIESRHSISSSRDMEYLSSSNMISEKNIEFMEGDSKNTTPDVSLDEQVNESSEILFLQADICFVQGDIKENKRILFYICDKYKGTEIGNRAKKELLRLYGEEVFREERLNI